MTAASFESRLRELLDTDPIFKDPLTSKTVDYQPVELPFKVYLQALAVAGYFLIPIVSVIVSIALIFNPITVIPFIGYLLWINLFQTFHEKGLSLKSNVVRSSTFFKLFRDYFPVRLVKSASLSSSSSKKASCIFGYHPHGVIANGSLINFSTETTGFKELFPEVGDVSGLTLTMNFKIPFSGIVLGLLGASDASAKNINYVLSQGNSVVLVLGGAKEALDARPGDAVLHLKNRKGFVKIALKQGATLVPCFGFGELDLYDQISNPPGSRLRSIQDFLQKYMGMSLPLIKGSYGLMPHRKNLTTVVGRPIVVPRFINEKEITQDVIDKYHELYMAALLEVFEFHKKQYGSDNLRLIFQ
eukprot:TRINITY_DN72194_c0_g1_i1.p1 TRINITY_DN72194_c0_g1~~TRINITY_DN72194_c0_g1_i1.p1  ORF type:complete len:358 (-),score=92.85 TRINITY_DN72194_c0_g1_i1:88-1161(-)